MNKRISFQYRIVATMIIVTLLVSITGVFTYRRFCNIITEVTKESRVDMRLVTAKSLMNEVYEAENNAKTYSLTKDTTYLEKFYQSTDRAINKLEKLHSYTSQKEMLVADVDSLDTLVVNKFQGLNDYLILQDKYRVEIALDKVIENVEKKVVKKEEDKEEEEEKGFLYKLFNRNKEKDKAQKELKEKITVGVVSDEVKSIKTTEKIIETNRKQKEVELLTTDTKINKQINTLITRLEAKEMDAISNQTKKAEEVMHKTNWQIAVFSVLTGLLLILMAYLIINYVRNNRRYRQALKLARAKAEDLAKTKEQFLANMSHELRTPMNAIAGFTEQLSKSKLTKEQGSQLSMVRKSIDHLLYLINDVLDFTKLQAGKLKLENIGFRPKEFVEDVVAFAKPLAEQKKTEISCTIKTSNDLILLGDPFRLRQILLNLISNSLKFTEKGSVTVTFSQLMKHDSHAIIRLEVQDSGIGMNEEQLARVFEEFEQAEGNTSRNYGGTGLGLSIVHMLTDLHDGKIEITSKPAKGTTVTVEIPYEIGTEEDMARFDKLEKEKNATLTIPKNLKILIVDDEKYNRKLLTTILKNHQAHFTEAVNGEEAVKEFRSNDYDLVLMDSYMPELDGVNASIKIREMESKNKKSVPIIALTAAVSEDDQKNYTNAGMNGFVAKPFNENELLSEIKRVLTTSKNQKTLRTNKESLNKTKQKENTHIEFSALKTLSDGDEEFYKDMLNTFLDSTSEGISDIEKALQNNDWKMLADYSHKVCAPAKHLSANVLYSHLKQIETKSRNKESLDSIENNVEEVKKEFKFIKKKIEAELKKPHGG